MGYIQEDITDYSACGQALPEKVDAVFHLAKDIVVSASVGADMNINTFHAQRLSFVSSLGSNIK